MPKRLLTPDNDVLEHCDTINKRSRIAAGSQAEASHLKVLSCQPIYRPDQWAFQRPRDPSHAKIVTWNVNSLRALLREHTTLFLDYTQAEEPDVLCLQETKMDSQSIPLSRKSTPFKKVALLEDLGYDAHYNCCTSKKGYAGTAIYVKRATTLGPPVRITDGLLMPGLEEANAEGRCITVEFAALIVVTAYVPNSGVGTPTADGKSTALGRLDYRLEVWEPAMRAYLSTLRQRKPVVFCGDLNVAHAEIDVHSPDPRSAGFTPGERAAFGLLLGDGWVDAYRHLHPDSPGAYTYWGYRTDGRTTNHGWRLDYFLLSPELVPCIKAVEIRGEVGAGCFLRVANAECVIAGDSFLLFLLHEIKLERRQSDLSATEQVCKCA